jgi:transketolase
LFLSGYGLELKDLEALRTWGSLTPGHPEYKHTAGVEITTGPLGQGLASAVGFAYSQRRQRGLFDADAPAGESPFDHNIWVIASDGDLQEGVTSEASSLAGHQELGNLVVIYDQSPWTFPADMRPGGTAGRARRTTPGGLRVHTRQESGEAAPARGHHCSSSDGAARSPPVHHDERQRR